MSYKIFVLLFSFSFLSFGSNSKKITKEVLISKPNETTFRNLSLYNQLDANSFELPPFECFSIALDGFYYLKEKGKIEKEILTLIDFSKSSNNKRLWVIDLNSKKILFQSLVAHGRNTGEEFATQFSNEAKSLKSSVGFYATGEIYNGKHGLSLKLDGLQKGLNDNARDRAVIVHGAEYVSEDFIKSNKRLGRSQGCPAVPKGLNLKLINLIKNKTCLFIYHPSAAQEIKMKLNT